MQVCLTNDFVSTVMVWNVSALDVYSRFGVVCPSVTVHRLLVVRYSMAVTNLKS